MAHNVQHPVINWTSANLQTEWKRFQQHAELMFQGPLHSHTEERKCAFLLIWVGDVGREIYSAWNLSAEDSKKLNVLLENFNEHCAPKKNSVFSRYIFHERRQKQGESFETFVTDLRNLVKDCTYDKANEMVRDRIVAGVLSPEIREKLLNEGDTLTMDKAIEISAKYEATRQCLKSMASASSEENVDALKKKKPQQQKQEEIVNCRNCGGNHKKMKCPAFGQKCHNCSKVNHYASVCRGKKKIHSVEEEEKEDDNDLADTYCDAIDGEDYPDTAFAQVILSTGDKVRFKIDSGSQANIIPFKTYKKLHMAPPLRGSTCKLFSYSGQRLSVKGDVSLKCSYKNNSFTGTFHVVETPSNSQPILGLQACLQLRLIQLILSVNSDTPLTKDKVLDEYKQLFTGLGELEGDITVHLKDDATPTVHAPRRVPHAIKPQLKKELKKMEDTGVIVKVTEPTDWVNSLVVVEKPDGKLRICLDPKDLNEAIRRPHYQLPTLEDALAKMAGAKYFSKLDARSGYWQLKLDQKSSLMTTFNTPFGRYRFRRLPFGIVCAQDIFQRKMDETFEGIEGVTPLIDDVIVHGRTREEHDANLRKALQRAEQKNLKLNPEKLTVGAQQVEYFGHLITSEGLKPDPNKVKAIQNMPPPSDKKELQTLLGMITYLAKFAPQLSDLTKPMRDLLKDDSEFIWDENQQQALQKIKNILSNKPVLAYFDPQKKVRLEVDASKNGLGAAIFQDDKPVAFASKSLTPSEQNYAQIEKELYAILFGCRRFHQYLYGREITVFSDHKPLESITKKPLSAAPPRLQRMLLNLQKYRLKIQYVPGKSIPVADTLSRKYIPAEPEDVQVDLDEQVHTIIKNLPFSDQKMTLIRQRTLEDKELFHLKKYIQHGWPDKKQCHSSTEAFWTYRDELSIVDNVILKGEKVFIPTSVRPEIMTWTHSSHMGIEKSKQRARDILFWPGMSSDIENYVKKCDICQRYQHSNPKEPLTPHEIPTRPWQKIASDLFTWNNKSYLVTVDYHSRYFELDELKQTSSAEIIRKLSVHFARHGIPEIVMSDNGPQFSSAEFANFAKTWDFLHTTSSPRYPQSNGLAEKYVQICKNILEKTKLSGTSPLIAILEYRTTPVDNFASPAQLLMGRRLRSILPVYTPRLEPQTPQNPDVLAKRILSQQRQKKYYDRTATPLKPLKEGQPITVQREDGTWKPAAVLKSGEHNSYTVQTPEGAVYRRNRRHLRPNPAPASGNPPDPQRPPADQQADQQLPPPIPAEPAPPNINTNKPYVTKAGREVKPPRKLDL